LHANQNQCSSENNSFKLYFSLELVLRSLFKSQGYATFVYPLSIGVALDVSCILLAPSNAADAF
jgi:hypothetical protein